ncbi:MAG: restriction endonuclease subunit S [Cyanobacteria bacterium]|nr:restriction endonuclease subunit S [Cyanobacteriota bacterium]
MSSEWQEYRLGDITRWASGATPSKQNPEYWGGSIPWISASSMKAKICAISDERITEEAVRSGARMCEPGTILLLVRGSELHKRIPIGVATTRVVFNQDVKAITTCSGDLLGDYLYYLLKGNEEFLLNSVEFTGIGAGKLETPFLQDLVFPLPTREEQTLITDFMIALDDKIELNRKTNETLEAMAKALFKSWFVDFDPVRAKAEGRPTGLPAVISDLFPDSFEDSELGDIPSGWRVAPVGDVVECVGGSTPSTNEPKYWDGGEYFWATPKDLSSLSEPFLLDTAKKITADGVQRISSGILPVGTVLLSSRAPVGYVSAACVPVSINQGFIALKSNGLMSSAYLLNWCLSNVQQFKDRASGTTFAEISKAAFRPIPLLVPREEVAKSFSDKAHTLYERVVSNMRQSTLLASTRDALLPKLISGEIRIPDAEKMLEEVGI